jgi:diguanylate cyclase (GGDEF)-like protein/PAS domain S-box-containing protein
MKVANTQQRKHPKPSRRKTEIIVTNRIKAPIKLTLPAVRISFSLSMLALCILLSANFFGFIPNEEKFLLESRQKISESIAIQFLVLDPVNDIEKHQKLIRYFVRNNTDILSAAIRSYSGRIVYQSQNHQELWQNYNKKESTPTHVFIPLLKNGRPWGNVEIRYKALKNYSVTQFLDSPLFKASVYFVLLGFFIFLVFILKILRELDPSSVIPDRVNTAFDTLTEAIVIIDNNENILMTNKSFNDAVEWPSARLTGRKISTLKWKSLEKNKLTSKFPWSETLKTNKNTSAIQLAMQSTKGNTKKFSVNVASIIGDTGKAQGALISLSDITKIEERNRELRSVVSQLKKSQSKVKEQNTALSYLATHDPMTDCLNRRAFSEQFETLFNISQRNNSDLSYIMVDLDHFKLVNDNYGHAKGDEVIKVLAEVLKVSTRQIDLVGRYGGEEFCLVLPGIPVEKAITTAERIRLKVEEVSVERFNGQPRVTASVGVASMSNNPLNPDDLTNKADEALYVAKESGRNQVVIWKKQAPVKMIL